MENNNKHIKAIYMIRENKDRSYWTKIGVAFVNHDGSLNVQLDAVPLDGKFQIRNMPAAKEAPSSEEPA